MNRVKAYEPAAHQPGGLGRRADRAREYCRLADIEATFRSFKDELGLRPLHHSLGKRVAGHLSITVLAY